MKYRQSQPTIDSLPTKYLNSRLCNTPKERPSYFSITPKGITKRLTPQIYSEQVFDLLDDEIKLKEKASQFIQRMARERMYRRGKLLLLKQKDEERRKIRTEVESKEKVMKGEILKMQRRVKAEQEIQARKKEITTIKKSRVAFKETQSRNSNKKTHSRLVLKQKPLPKLTNEIYLDQQQKTIELARKKLIRLSTMIDDTQRMKQQC